MTLHHRDRTLDSVRGGGFEKEKIINLLVQINIFIRVLWIVYFASISFKTVALYTVLAIKKMSICLKKAYLSHIFCWTSPQKSKRSSLKHCLYTTDLFRSWFCFILYYLVMFFGILVHDYTLIYWFVPVITMLVATVTTLHHLTI